MFNLKVKNDRGDMLDLTNSPDYTVYKITGLNPPQATVNRSVNTTSDGSQINSVRLESRNIVIYVKLNGVIEDSRLNLYKYFPIKKTVTLYFKNDTRDVCICGTVELIECDLFSRSQVAQISLICPSTYFRAVNDVCTYFSSVLPMFSFPFAISQTGIEFSTIAEEVRKSIINTGDVETGVIIKMFTVGTVVNPTIYNVITREQIRLNMTLQESDTVIINTNVREKSITLTRDGVTTNIIGNMSRNSDWFTLSAGDNVFTYSAESGQSNLQITFTNSILYSGV